MGKEKALRFAQQLSGRRRLRALVVPLALIPLGALALLQAVDASAAENPLLTSVGGAKASASLDVMTFNVRSVLFNGSGSKDYEKSGRRAAVAGAILNELPDLVGTQENVKFQADDLYVDLRDGGHRYDWYGEQRDCQDGTSGCGDQNETVAIFWNPERLERKSQGDFYFCGDGQTEVRGCVDNQWPTWQAGSPRMATWVRFLDKVTNKEFVAINTHLDNTASQARERAAQKVVDKLAGIDPNNLPVILTGDFNSGSGEKAYEIVTKAGFKDSWPAAAKRGDSYETFRNDPQKPPVKGGGPIDFIFTKGAGTVSAAAVSTFSKNGVYPSDHTPVLARLDLG